MYKVYLMIILMIGLSKLESFCQLDAIPNYSAGYVLTKFDSRVKAFGDIDVVSSDLYAFNGLTNNPALLSRNNKSIGLRLSYLNWLTRLNLDFHFLNGHIYYSFSDKHSIGYSFTNYHDDFDNYSKTNRYYQMLRYAYSISNKFSLGVGLKHIKNYGNKRRNHSIAGDFGVNYFDKIIIDNIDIMNIEVGAALLNVGEKIYSSNSHTSQFIPTTLSMGTLLGINRIVSKEKEISLDVAFQFSKILTPIEWDTTLTVFKGIWYSFTDAPGGIKQEIKQIERHSAVDIEYKHNEIFKGSIRIGKVNNDGNWKNNNYYTWGVGVNYKMICFDYAYLFGSKNAELLNKTWSISLGIINWF